MRLSEEASLGFVIGIKEVVRMIKKNKDITIDDLRTILEINIEKYEILLAFYKPENYE